ncbi:MAG: hypothetical protein M1521_02990 [Thermotogae bacterium]|jgi:transposase-like protein|nr:hypothetical protein [Thermotogota bacterium]
MEKKKLMAKDEIKRFIKENNIKDIAGIEESLKRMFSSVIEEMLEAELEDQLGYTKYDYKSNVDNAEVFAVNRRRGCKRSVKGELVGILNQL